jgi:hypothetical protein
MSKERGWRRVLPAVALFLLLPPTFPYLRALVPIEQTLLLLTTSLAVCAWVAWRENGPLWLAMVWTGIAVWVFSKPLAGGSAYVALAYGWSLLLAGAFGAVSLWRPHRPFFGRAMMSIGVAAFIAIVVLAIVRTSPQQLERVIATEFADRIELSLATLRQDPQLYPKWAALDIEKVLRELITVGGLLFPAMLFFESLAALGLAWSLHHRFSRTRVGPPIAPLREFRFEDQFIWGVIAGLILTLVPELVLRQGLATDLGGMRQVGWNLLLFFGGLYGLRGLGVMTWFLVPPGRWLGAALVAACAILPPLWSFPIGIGLGDTYFDWRRRVPPSNQRS